MIYSFRLTREKKRKAKERFNQVKSALSSGNFFESMFFIVIVVGFCSAMDYSNISVNIGNVFNRNYIDEFVVIGTSVLLAGQLNIPTSILAMKIKDCKFGLYSKKELKQFTMFALTLFVAAFLIQGLIKWNFREAMFGNVEEPRIQQNISGTQVKEVLKNKHSNKKTDISEAMINGLSLSNLVQSLCTTMLSFIVSYNAYQPLYEELKKSYKRKIKSEVKKEMLQEYLAGNDLNTYEADLKQAQEQIIEAASTTTKNRINLAKDKLLFSFLKKSKSMNESSLYMVQNQMSSYKMEPDYLDNTPSFGA